MALLKIARMGRPVLRAKAEPVRDPTDPEIRRLAADMLQTMIDAPGVGLAAPQVYASVRMITIRVPAGRNDGQDIPGTVLINPVLEPIGDDMAAGFEGCLSIPGLRGVVPRHTKVRYHALDLDGRLIEGTAEGFHARVLQHEVDHLDGVLYLDRIPDMRLLAFEDEAHHIAELLNGEGEEDEQ